MNAPLATPLETAFRQPSFACTAHPYLTCIWFSKFELPSDQILAHIPLWGCSGLLHHPPAAPGALPDTSCLSILLLPLPRCLGPAYISPHGPSATMTIWNHINHCCIPHGGTTMHNIVIAPWCFFHAQYCKVVCKSQDLALGMS